MDTSNNDLHPFFWDSLNWLDDNSTIDMDVNSYHDQECDGNILVDRGSINLNGFIKFLEEKFKND